MLPTLHQFTPSSLPAAGVISRGLYRIAQCSSPWSYTCSIHTPANAQLVWKMFCTMPLGALSAAALSSSTSARLRDQPKAPMLSLTLLSEFAPGIGMVFCAMHQLMATCATVLLRSSAIACMRPRSGLMPGSICLNRSPLGPLGSLPASASYFPVSIPRPCASRAPSSTSCSGAHPQQHVHLVRTLESTAATSRAYQW